MGPFSANHDFPFCPKSILFLFSEVLTRISLFRRDCHLRPFMCGSIGKSMWRLGVIIIGIVSLCSCKKREEVIAINQTRQKSTIDVATTTEATSLERFRGKKAASLQKALPVAPPHPEHWKPQAATQFRLLNFATERGVEIYLSQVRGGVEGNFDRWMKQFGQTALTPEQFSGLPKLSFMDHEGRLLEVTGPFAGGMGKTPIKDAALIGAGVVIGADTWTMKMIGPREAVLAEKDSFIQFVSLLKKNS